MMINYFFIFWRFDVLYNIIEYWPYSRPNQSIIEFCHDCIGMICNCNINPKVKMWHCFNVKWTNYFIYFYITMNYLYICVVHHKNYLCNKQWTRRSVTNFGGIPIIFGIVFVKYFNYLIILSFNYFSLRYFKELYYLMYNIVGVINILDRKE